MDAQEYDRIADLLMQIRKKYRTLGKKIDDRVLVTPGKAYNAIELISIVLELNDYLAEMDAKGWL